MHDPSVGEVFADVSELAMLASVIRRTQSAVARSLEFDDCSKAEMTPAMSVTVKATGNTWERKLR
jgi:hypothetical protein